MHCMFDNLVKAKSLTQAKIVSDYDQEIPQSQTADNPMAHSTITRHQEDKIKLSNQLSLPHQDDCNTRMDIN